MQFENENELYHYGTPRHSGRYPWGSGKDPYQHCANFLRTYNGYKKSGLSESEIANEFGMTLNQLVKTKTAAGGQMFLDTSKSFRRQGYNNTEIAARLGLSTVDFRAQTTLANERARAANARQAKKLIAHGYSQNKAAQIMGVPESSLRNMIKEEYTAKTEKSRNIANEIKSVIEKNGGFVDVGAGVEAELGVTETAKKAAINLLKNEGYEHIQVQIPQATNPSQKTTIDVIAPGGTSYIDVKENLQDINPIIRHSTDNGKTFFGIQYPSSIDSSRVHIKYDEDGGTLKDGVIELRRNVADLSMGSSNYAQVRIAVDDKLYCKGMAIYSDDKNFPPGCDIIVNSNKHRGTPLEKVLKPMKTVDAKDEHGNVILDKDGNPKQEINKENPFGAVIKANGQNYYESKGGKYIKDENGNFIDKDLGATSVDGKEYSLSAVNMLKEQGDWDHYSKNLSSQFLSKQSMDLINKQLNLSIADKKAEFDEICAIPNAEVKQKLLEDFSDGCDSAAVKLKAAALPQQSSKVILPCTSLKDDECYAPTYKDGTQLALIRYPHAGTFEIPIVTVNNKNTPAEKIVGRDSIDAIGINSNVAERLSGADFDGDTVMAIPTNTRNGVKITSTPALKGLEGFNSKDYAFSEEALAAGAEVISSTNKQKQMGVVSNLITDMTLQGATPDEMARAVRHSMVVIDAEKHKLDYKASAEENGIAQLQARYQRKVKEDGSISTGAGTLISRAKSRTDIEEQKYGAWVTTEDGKTKKQYIDPETGEKLYEKTGRSYSKMTLIDPDTKKKVQVFDNYDGTVRSKDGTKTYDKDKVDIDVDVKMATQKTTKMEATKDARTLISEANTPQEQAYANYANALKDLGNQARKVMVNTPNSTLNKSAADTYHLEVASLKAKLNEAIKNAPREREAQVMAYRAVEEQMKIDSSLADKGNLKKARQQAIAQARISTGAKSKDTRITVTPREWDAIQAGAISSTTLKDIIKNTNMDTLRELATPKENKSVVSEAKANRIKAYRNSGYTIAQIADSLGLSPSTISNYLKD